MVYILHPPFLDFFDPNQYWLIEYLWKVNLWQQDPYNYDAVFIRVSYLIFYFSSFLLELKFSLSCISSSSISQIICGMRLDHHTKRYLYLLIRTIWKMECKIFWQKCQRFYLHSPGFLFLRNVGSSSFFFNFFWVFSM